MTATLERAAGPPCPAPVQISPWGGHAPDLRALEQGAVEPLPYQQPRLAEGVVLLGELEGSGYRKPHYLARRSNGSLVQLSHLLYLTADACDGRRTVEQVAAVVSDRFGRAVSGDNVRTLLDRLRPLGVLAGPDGTSPELSVSDPLLGLKYRATVVPARWTPRIARLMHPLFWPAIIVLAGAALVAFDGWLFFVHGLGSSLRASVEAPLVFLLVAGLIVASAALHELGHAAACSYGGGRPGRMGFGVYIAWPAFYTDVTDAYRLSRSGRLRTDLGGVYLNALVILMLAGLYVHTSYEPLLLVCFIIQVQMIQQMLPVLRLDGYYVLSDAIGVPDLFRRIGPILSSAVPGRPVSQEVLELRRRARLTVTAWVLVVVPLLLINLAYLLLSAPRIAATTWDSAARLVGQLTSAETVVVGAAAAVQLVFLLIPPLAIALTVSRLGRRLAAAAWRWSRGSLRRRLMTILGAAMLVATLLIAWWPDVRLSPYLEDEQGRLPDAVQDLQFFGQGHALLRSPTEAQTALPRLEPGSSGIEQMLSREEDDPAGPPSESEAPQRGKPAAPAPVTPTRDQPSSGSTEQEHQPRERHADIRGTSDPATTPGVGTRSTAPAEDGTEGTEETTDGSTDPVTDGTPSDAEQSTEPITDETSPPEPTDSTVSTNTDGTAPTSPSAPEPTIVDSDSTTGTADP